MASPQVIIKDYSAKSIVLRSIPTDFFKQYSQHLTQPDVAGKWNPGLKEPPGSQNVLAGWIFPKRFEARVRQVVDQIVSGQVGQAPPKWMAQPAAPTFATGPTFAPAPSFSLPSTPSVFGQLRHPGLIAPPTSSPQVVPQLTAAPQMAPTFAPPPLPVMPAHKPTVEGNIQLELGGYKYHVTMESLNGNTAILLLPDGQKAHIELEGSEWKITGFPQPHSILFG